MNGETIALFIEAVTVTVLYWLLFALALCL